MISLLQLRSIGILGEELTWKAIFFFFFFKIHGELYQNPLLNGIFPSDLKYYLYLKLNSPSISVLFLKS